MTRKRIYEIAKEFGVTSKELISKLAEMGMPDLKAANSVNEEEYGLIVNLYQEETVATSEAVAEEVEELVEKQEEKKEKDESGVPRSPIVSVLGHIDHGKTTLLDAIRHSHVTAKEVGGITQGVAAYQADLGGQVITFIDTPGHKAFTGMRARGAKATDIAILVVAADDGIMEQTLEAIDHIHAAGIPMIVAINKIDKPNADIDRVMNDLTKHGLTPEAWGGDTITVSISALNGENIDDLLEMILLVAEMENLRAGPAGPLEAVIIESHLAKGRGPVATAIVRNGTLHEKDIVVAGSTWGRVRAMTDDTGARVPEAGPGKAVEILGLQDVPHVGTTIEVKKSQNDAKTAAAKQMKEEAVPRRSRAKMSVEDLFLEAAEAEKLRLILKASSTGALAAAKREIEGIGVEDVEVEFIHTGVGPISEGDVLLASSIAEDCVVVGFGVSPDAKTSKLAERDGVAILTYDIIYNLLAEIEHALKSMLAPEYEEVRMGEADIREVFNIPDGVVAGCYVTNGKIERKAKARVLREDKELFVGEILSLQRFTES
ncbi:MAG: translation initiation factor IF-2, partial [Candidatus Bipolaricaulota bacterium]|nr:translation initiation factor IF-2 [Candidatus Bipolaricaulota bacterium]